MPPLVPPLPPKELDETRWSFSVHPKTKDDVVSRFADHLFDLQDKAKGVGAIHIQVHFCWQSSLIIKTFPKLLCICLCEKPFVSLKVLAWSYQQRVVPRVIIACSDGLTTPMLSWLSKG